MTTAAEIGVFDGRAPRVAKPLAEAHVAEYAESLPFPSRHAERRGQMAELRSRLETALVDRYTIGREIGRGGMAIVYLAHDLRHDRDVALKVLRPELAATLGPDRFLQEIRLAAGLSHPHILPLHDSGEADGCLFYVMPYVPGESLRDRLEAQGQLPLVDALEIAREIADALDYAHRAGVVHRDIKPENILLQSGHAAVSDFGIARAISAAGDRRWTAAGIAVGTPDYMSPEQAAGVGHIDGRSDLYSLGCVLFEMLAGRPPLAVTPPEGPSAGPASPRDRLGELELFRPSVPREVAGVVARLLAIDPADRFGTAAEAAEALRAPSDVWTPRSVTAKRRGRRWAVGVGIAATLVIGAGALSVAPRVLNAKLDRSRIVVVPFGHQAGAASSLLKGDLGAILISQAFERWQDVQVLDPLQVSDALRRREDTALTLGAAKAVARELGAGLLLWGQVDDAGDSIVVTAALYDLTKLGRVLKSHTVRVDRARGALVTKLHELADSLLLGAGNARAVGDAAAGTHVLAALYAYVAGREAVGRWELDSAARAFRTALALDPQYPHAHLWLAQVLAWSEQPTETWEYHARAAARPAPGLGYQERLLAVALADFAAGDVVQSCADYSRIVARDSLSFAGWYGLGECLRADHTVVRDPASPTGWSWRTSLRAAQEAYERALDVVPSAAFRFPPFSRLSRTLFVDASWVRFGLPQAPDTGRFFAKPSLLHDTLAFVPIPAARFAAVGDPTTTEQAVAADRTELLRLVRRWVREFPDSSQPYLELATSLELVDALDLPGGIETSALAAARQALATARTAADSVHATVLVVRLLVKLGRFDDAQKLAAGELARWAADPAPPYASEVAALAVLLGKGRSAARAVSAWAEQWQDDPAYSAVPFPVAQTSRLLLAYAALGAPEDSIVALAARLDTIVRVHPKSLSVSQAAWCDVVQTPITIAFPQIHRPPDLRRCPGTDMLLMESALVQGDTGAVRREFAKGRDLRRGASPGGMAAEHVLLETWLLLQVGDTTTAVQYADEYLAVLSTLRTTVILDQPAQTGALVRLMALRADLAARAGDQLVARRWAAAVATVWREADTELQPIVLRMQALSQ